MARGDSAAARRRSVRSSRSSRPTIVEHAIDPDLWRTAGWEQEPPRHFLDMDAYGPYPFTGVPARPRGGRQAVRHGLRREERARCRGAPQEIYEKLVEAFTQTGAVLARQHQVLLVGARPLRRGRARAVPRGAQLRRTADRPVGHSLAFRDGAVRALPRRRCASCREPVVPIANAREFIFETLIASFPLVADRCSTRTRPPSRGASSTTTVFHDVLREGAADPGAAAGRSDHRRRRR